MPKLRNVATAVGSAGGVVALTGVAMLAYGTVAGVPDAVRVGVGLVVWPLLSVIFLGPSVGMLRLWWAVGDLRREQDEQRRQIATVASHVAEDLDAENPDHPRVARMIRRDGS